MSSRKVPDWITAHLPRELVDGSTLFRFKVPIPSGKIEVDMLPDLDLDYDILENQMQDIPAQYAFYAAIYSELRLMVAKAERNFKVRKGEATQFVTDRAKEAGTRLSVESIKMIVEADEELAKADMRLGKVQMLCGKMYHMLESIKMKSELARSLAGFKRQEQEQS